MGIVWFAAFVMTVYGANWALATYGFVDVGFGVTAPAGALFAGLAFTFRDLTHEALGRVWAAGAVLVGCLLAYVLEDVARIAIASAVAFGVSEGLDLVVYDRLRRRDWLTAVAASNVVGLAIDSALFLMIAFGSLAYVEGQIIAKGYMTIAAVAVLWGARWSISRVKSRRASMAV